MKKILWLLFIVFLTAIIFLLVQNLLIFKWEYNSLQNASQLRNETLHKINKLNIAIVESTNSDKTLSMGAELAVAEINSSGGILGKKVNVVTYNNTNSVKNALIIADKVCQNYNIAAVLNHNNIKITTYTFQNYDFFGLLAISTVPIAQRISSNSFSMIPNGKFIATGLANVLISKNLFKPILIFSDNDLGIKSSSNITSLFTEKGIEVAARSPFNSRTISLQLKKKLLRWIKDYTFDSIIIVNENISEISRIIKNIKEAGIYPPIYIYFPRYFNSENNNLCKLLKETNINFKVYNPHNISVKMFNKKFYKKFKRKPTQHAVWGYDGVRFICEAFQKAGTITPAIAGEEMYNLQIKNMPSGIIGFNKNGFAIIDRNNFIDNSELRIKDKDEQK